MVIELKCWTEYDPGIAGKERYEKSAGINIIKGICSVPTAHLRERERERVGGAYLAKPYSAKPESAVQESAKPYLAKPGNC